MNQQQFNKAYWEIIQAIVDNARLVTLFDGADRDSLDLLRQALYKLGKLQFDNQHLGETYD